MKKVKKFTYFRSAKLCLKKLLEIIKERNLNFKPRSLKCKPGIYTLIFPDKSFYIGSTVNCRRRIVEHILALEARIHTNYKIQKKYDKYGMDGITVDFLPIEKKELAAVEQKMINENIGKRKNLNIAKTVWRKNRKCSLSGLDLRMKTHAKDFDATASLDRINSELGYEANNIQWIHKDINFMKREYRQSYFLDLCRQIVHHTNNDKSNS